MRLFISVPLPKPVRKELAEIKKKFSEFPAKWVEEENLHTTLIFIGEVGEKSELGEISDILNGTSSKPISLKTDGLSLLPDEKRPHILVIKLAGETERISALVEKIKRELRERKVNFDEKAFRPHITLARLKKLRSGEKKELKEKIRLCDLPKIEFKTKQIELTESKLTPAGPIYKVLKHRVLYRE